MPLESKNESDVSYWCSSWSGTIHVFWSGVWLGVDSGGALPLIFCIHVRSEPIYWGVIHLAKKIIR